jgi:DNA-binding CsgD family transcriptional regulator
MKLHRRIGLLFFAAFLAACSPYPRESERMADAMAQAEAVYGDGNLLVETDTVLFIPGLAEASGYYAGKKQYAKAALAALYNGYTERDFDKEAAMASFKEAEHYGELAGDSLTMARAEYWMGKLLYGEGGKQEALSMLESSCNHIGNRCSERAFVENGLAVSYMLMGQYDSAEYHLQNSFKVAQEEHCDLLIWKNLNNLSVLYRILKEYENSLHYQRKMIQLIEIDSVKQVLVFLNFGNTFTAMDEMDSAAFYYQQLENVLQVTEVNDETKLSAYGALIKFVIKQGNDSLALQYRDKHEDALYDVMCQQQKQTIYRIQKQYDYEALQNMMSKKIIRRHRFMLGFGLLSLVLSVIVLILRHRHNQLLKAEDDLKRKLNTMKEDLRQTVNTSVVDKVLVSQLRNIIVANRTMSRAKDAKNEWRALLLEVMAGQEDTFEAAKTVIEKAYPNLLYAIYEKHPDLSDTEARVCLMSCFDLTNSEIAELLGLSVNTVNQNRSALRRKLSLRSEKLGKQLRDLLEK